MTAITIPLTWVEYDRYKDTVVYSRPSHTNSVVDLVIFKRTVSTNGAVTGKYSVKWVKGVDDIMSLTDNASYPNTFMEFSVRHVEGELAGNLTAMAAEFATLLADTGLVESLSTTGNLPQ